MVNKFFSVVLILIGFLSANGQEEDSYHAPFRFNDYVECLVPSPVTNTAFRNSFVGIYTLNGSANVMLFQNFYIGICGSNSLYKVPTNKVISTSVNAAGGYDLSDLYQVNSGGLNLGHAYYFSPGNFLTTSIAVGPSFSKFTEVQIAVPVVPPAELNKTFNAIFVQAACGIQFSVEDHFGLGFSVSYTMLNHAFNPNDIALNQFASYSAAEAKGNMSFVELGFSVYFGYVKKKK